AWLALTNVARLREFITFLILAAVVLIFHVKTLAKEAGDPYPSIFLSPANIRAILVGISTEAILVVGMVMVIVGGGFDISVGSVLALSGLVTVQALKLGCPVWLGCSIGLACGAVCGLINGLLVSKIGMSPLIATLGMMLAARGLVTVHVHAHGAISSFDLPDGFLALGQSELWGTRGFWIVVIMIVVVIIGDILLRNLRWLRQVYYIGGNERAAALSGINVPRVRAVTFVICGVTAALAGVLNSARFGTATFEAGMGVELQVIAQCVIGGASLVGGQGTVLGAFLGVLLVNCVKVGLTQVGVPPDWQYVIVGGALIVFVSVDIFLAKRRRG
ncbi:MAG TPA: ABC transporter permease, partial [Armatimonadota bacterium]|nr:ABC transporter permease [Armatimonadota bacterium]